MILQQAAAVQRNEGTRIMSMEPSSDEEDETTQMGTGTGTGTGSYSRSAHSTLGYVSCYERLFLHMIICLGRLCLASKYGPQHEKMSLWTKI